MRTNGPLRRTVSAGIVVALLGSALLVSQPGEALEVQPADAGDVYGKRMELYVATEAMTLVPWTLLAAVDQYARSLRRGSEKELVAVRLPPPLFSGVGNPSFGAADEATIDFFGGKGRDANGDGFVDPDDPLDRLFSVAAFLRERMGEGGSEGEGALCSTLEELLGDGRACDVVPNFARVYETFGRLDLHRHVFVLPPGSRYTLQANFGAPRHFGGRRIHEGVDIFAPYGTPVRAATYGYVEVVGWNRLGGWRVGIRDLQNFYHYYAHLSGFAKGIEVGKAVAPGEILGYVGSSGYGPPGTQGKFPPHLHYGLYRWNGRVEYAVDPAPHLRAWLQEEKKGKTR
ncbi:MAG: Cell wall endopeptidase, family M23/M37 [Brockia lithotrophica]|uniref:Cell wall endopeptidase, family M23/M37 n=1 Tax=Brockia lithotrophica TaxID=933949 RepID=A0A2T5GAM4_9BACL|nr:M23 family metallopeptidase [Brockia lithotrophica]PTQ53220.1 MAG: Cell wall endopeptidase, family M23/M37 [Brockia lithotrophica]